MIIPSIDLMGGQAVQLIGGEKMAIKAGDPLPIAEKFSIAGEIAVIDLDAALGTGNNEKLILEIIKRFPSRVGGGIRDYDTALKWLDAGAQKIILGTAARPELLSKFPKERLIAALDAKEGEVVVEGWKKKTGRTIFERISELRELVGGFLVTFVEIEGRMGGTNLELAKKVIEAAQPVRVTIAGGVKSAEEIAELDSLGADAQVGMALYSGAMELADAIIAPMKSERADGLFPTVVVDEAGKALGLVYSSKESVREAIRRKRGVYHSRKRGIWLKGESSGNIQELLRIDLDCDRDSFRFIVRQTGSGFCHKETFSCWGEDWGLSKLMNRLENRVKSAPTGSYTKRLLDESELLAAKLVEEAGELAEAKTKDEVIWESADLIYFVLVAMVARGVSLSDVEMELERRSLKVKRRGGDAKSGAGNP
ncbi:MAG: hypothetical protein Kow0090_11280 [Myxococcota bacterium]